MSSLMYLSRWRPRASYLISFMYSYDNLIGKLLSEEILIHISLLQSFVSTQKATIDKNMAIVCLSLLSALAHSQNSYAYI